MQDDNDDEMSNTASWSPWMSTSSSTSTMLRQRHHQIVDDDVDKLDYSKMSYESASDPDITLRHPSQTDSHGNVFKCHRFEKYLVLCQRKRVLTFYGLFADPVPGTQTLNQVCSSLWLIVKLILSVGCCTLLCLALFVASRSLSCRWSGAQVCFFHI